MRSSRPAKSILGSLALGLRLLFALSPQAGLDSLSGPGVVVPSFALDRLSASSLSLPEAASTCWASFSREGFNFTVAFFDSGLVEAVGLQALA